MSNTYRIAKPSDGLKLAYPHAVDEDSMGRLMLRASAFCKPGIERTFWLDSNGGSFAAVGTAANATLNWLVPIQGGNFSKYDRFDLELTVRNPSLVNPIQISPAFAWIRKISYSTAGAPLLEQYGESLFALEALTPATLAVQEMENTGFTSTQFSQVPSITPAVGGGTISYPNVMTANQELLTLAPGETIKLLLPISKDLFLTSGAYAPNMVNQPINIRMEFNPGSWFCVQGNNQISLDLARITQCGRVYGPTLQSVVDRLRVGKSVRIPSHLITFETGPLGALAGARQTFTMQNFTGNYSGIFFWLRDRDVNASTNQMNWFWNARPQTYNITTGVLVAGSCGDEYACSDLNISPDGSISLYVNGQTPSQLKVLAQESADNRAYLLSEIKAINLFPFSDEFYRDVTQFRHEGGAVNLVSAAKFDYVPVTTNANAAPIVIGFKSVTIIQDSLGKLVCVDENSTAV